MGDELNLRFAATLTLMNVAIVLAMYFLGIFALMLFSAGIVAYLMYPLKSFVIRKTRVPNWLGSLMITTIGVSIVAYAAAKIIPIIYYRVRYILSLLPDAIQLFAGASAADRNVPENRLLEGSRNFCWPGLLACLGYSRRPG